MNNDCFLLNDDCFHQNGKICLWREFLYSVGVSNCLSWLLYSKWFSMKVKKGEEGLEYHASETFYNLWYVETKKGKSLVTGKFCH